MSWPGSTPLALIFTWHEGPQSPSASFKKVGYISAQGWDLVTTTLLSNYNKLQLILWVSWFMVRLIQWVDYSYNALLECAEFIRWKMVLNLVACICSNWTASSKVSASLYCWEGLATSWSWVFKARWTQASRTRYATRIFLSCSDMSVADRLWSMDR